MKKRFLFLALVLALAMTLLGGCAGTPSEEDGGREEHTEQAGQDVADEAQMKEDLWANETFNVYSDMYSDEMKITDLEIVKRRTIQEDRTDTVYVLVTLQDGAAQIEKACTMTYELYNEGWLLENVEVTEETVTPLAAPEYSMEELTNFLSWQGYTGIQDINVYDQTADLENGTASYSLTAKDVHKYMTEELDVTLNFEFTDWLLFWDCFDCTVNSSTEDWSAMYGVYDVRTVDYGIDSFDGVTLSWHRYLLGEYEDRREDYQCEAVPLYGTVSDEIAINHSFYPSDAEKYYRGYKIEYVGAEFVDVQYFADGWVIGRDHIYWMESSTSWTNEKTHSIEIECKEVSLRES